MQPQANIIAVDSALIKAQEDSLAREQAIADSIEAAKSIAPGSYKFIFETTRSRNRALRRHAQVNEISPRIKNGSQCRFNRIQHLRCAARHSIRYHSNQRFPQLMVLRRTPHQSKNRPIKK